MCTLVVLNALRLGMRGNALDKTTETLEDGKISTNKKCK